MTYCFANEDANSQFQLYDIPQVGSSGLIRVHGTNFCFDGGSNPTSGTHLKVWTCYDGAPQQTWTFNDNKMTLGPNSESRSIATRRSH